MKKCDSFILPLTDLERDICESLGVDITNEIDKVSNLNSEKLDEEIDDIAKAMKNETEREKFLSRMKRITKTNEDKKNYILNNFYKEQIMARNFEIDMLLGLKDYQSLVEIEVKSTTDKKKAKNVLNKAAKQLKKVNRTFEDFHKDILIAWKFVRVIALPNMEKADLEEDYCCSHCSKFIINTEEIKNFSNWIENLLSVLQYNPCPPDAYKKLFTRIVGFYSCSDIHSTSVTMSLRDTRVEYEKAITGNKRGVTSEETGVGVSLPKKMKIESLKDLKNKPLSSMEVMIYWNPSQLSLLMERKETQSRVLLTSDFGCGKTLLLKHFASHVARKERERKVFFVSLAAAEYQDICTSDRRPAVIDVANEVDFQEMDNVQVHFHLFYNLQ